MVSKWVLLQISCYVICTVSLTFKYQFLQAIKSLLFAQTRHYFRLRFLYCLCRIGVDPEVHEFIRATRQGNFWGPWQSWLKVPVEKRTSWWHSFIVSDRELLFPILIFIINYSILIFIINYSMSLLF